MLFKIDKSSNKNIKKLKEIEIDEIITTNEKQDKCHNLHESFLLYSS